MRYLLLSAALIGFANNSLADEAQDWLTKMANAMHAHDYSGTFVYVRGQTMDAMSVSHRNASGQEIEQVRTLTGDTREVTRNAHDMTYQCLDEHHRLANPTVRLPLEYSFNGKQYEHLTQRYDVHLGDQDRVAGMDCQEVVLQPKDMLRYAQTYCVESNMGLMLRSDLMDTSGVPIERMMFTDVTIQPAIGGAMSISSSPVIPLAPLDLDNDIWPVGFERVLVQEMDQGHGEHWVFSDGLAKVSVFIEPVDEAQANDRELKKGIFHLYQVTRDNRRVTVIGEVPAKTVRLMAESLP